jgi:hypothetical protein
MKRYRVWTVNFNQTVSCMNDWSSYRQCRRMIVGRWQCWPPFAYISTIQSADKFARLHGVS